MMWSGLMDSNNTKAELGTILRVKNLITYKVSYYLYDEKDNRQYLFKYDKSGKINYESFGNIKIDEGISLVNSDCWIWIVEGRKDEVYNKLFRE